MTSRTLSPPYCERWDITFPGLLPLAPTKEFDILAHTDALGTTAPRIKVQVKRRADKINAEGLRSFMAVLGDQDVGIFVSTGGFTSEAESEARTQERRTVTLLDLEKLFDLWVKNYDKIEESDKLSASTQARALSRAQ